MRAEELIFGGNSLCIPPSHSLFAVLDMLILMRLLVRAEGNEIDNVGAVAAPASLSNFWLVPSEAIAYPLVTIW